VIGTEEAYHIPDGKNVKGAGYFVRAPGAEPVKFRGFLLPNRYEPPTTINRRVITAKPRARLFTAERVEPDPDTVIETEVAGESVIEGPPRSLVLTVGPQLAAFYAQKPRQLWSPPLDDPIPLDKVLSQAATMRPGRVPWWPLGEVDRPRQLRHDLLTYSLNQGNVSIMGMRSAEVSLATQAFILSAASRYSPRDIGFYVLAYGGPELAAVKDLPHVGAVGGPDRKGLTLRIFGDLDAVLARRRRLFDRPDTNISSIEEYRRRRGEGDPALDDGYPTDIFLVVDGWENFLDDNTSLMHPKNPHRKSVERLIGAGRGMHVLVTSADWITLGQAIESKLDCKWELKLASMSVSQVRPRVETKMVRPQELIPVDQPGRGINSSGDVIRFAVGRTDGQPSMDDLDVKVRDTAAQISCRYAGQRRAPRPQLLPQVVGAADLAQDQLGGEQFALGVRGRDLAPLVIDFADVPLLGVYGDSKKGKTALVSHLLRSVVARRSSPQQVIVCVFDTSRRLRGETRLMVEGEDYYETDPASIAERLGALDRVLQARVPPKDLGWQQKETWRFDGPTIYVFIDDLDAIPQAVQTGDRVLAGGAAEAGGSRMVQVWPPLTRHMANARDIGLRVIMTHKAAGAYTAEVNPNTVPGQIHTQRSNRILLSSRSTNDKAGGVKFEEGLPPGRGYMIATSDDNEGYVQLAGHYDGMLPPC
jgi:type VII secretion protein EccCb